MTIMLSSSGTALSAEGEASQGGAPMDDYGDVFDKTQILSQ